MHGSKNVILPAKIESIKEMVKLCSMEIKSEEGVVDTINGKGLCAVFKTDAYINFDLEKIDFVQEGDSLIFYLPPEEVAIFESTEDESYRVVDEWSVDWFAKNNVSNAEENELKKGWKNHFKYLVYKKGHIKRARSNAQKTLNKLFSTLNDKVVVRDTVPDGFYKDSVYHKKGLKLFNDK